VSEIKEFAKGAVYSIVALAICWFVLTRSR